MKRRAKMDPVEAEAAWKDVAAPNGDSEIRADCELVTPMYGGGVAAGDVDEAMPIRSSALRGQLRFWWRLLNGNGQTSSDLFREEIELFGGITRDGPRASRVSVRVETESEPRVVLKNALVDLPDYAFMGPNAELRLLQDGFKWKLAITGCPAERFDQLIAAMRWWASFGGVGARTRRGLGSVRVRAEGITPVNEQEVLQLGGQLTLGTGADAIESWRRSVNALKRFRQLPDGRATATGNRPGRSRWPEADSIRALDRPRSDQTGERHKAHGYFPRALFGLPIVFQRDPKDTLTPLGNKERMASPLILRPYFDGTTYRPAALLLPGWRTRLGLEVELEKRPAKDPQAAWPETGRDAAADFVPMSGRGNDPLTAFMRYFAETVDKAPGRGR